VGVVLFVAELGGGFGHVRRLLPLAEAAARAGHRPLFLVPNHVEVAAFVSKAGFGLQAAPSIARRPLGAPAAGSVATSFADIIGGSGFADVDYLFDLVSAWDAAIAEIRPSAVVCEFSPFLNVATFGASLPVLVVGYGFVLPPPQLSKYPPLWDGVPLYEESRLLDYVTEICSRRARPAPAALPEILAGSAHAVTGLSALDPYRSQRLQAPVGLPFIEAKLTGAEPLHDVFAYLLGDAPSTTQALRVLGASGLRGRVFVRRGDEAHRRLLEGTAMTWLHKPEPTRRALNEARVIVHHGSMLLSEEALVSGRPQVIVPLYLEHILTARSLRDLGVASVVRSSRDPDEISRALGAGFADPTIALRAREFAEGFWRDSRPPTDLPDRLLREVIPEEKNA
jgi:UDP:flavonoid glycosyltransferase YjiC (YdhE family)